MVKILKGSPVEELKDIKNKNDIDPAPFKDSFEEQEDIKITNSTPWCDQLEEL